MCSENRKLKHCIIHCPLLVLMKEHAKHTKLLSSKTPIDYLKTVNSLLVFCFVITLFVVSYGLKRMATE